MSSLDITYDDKENYRASTLESKFEISAGDANEIKNKHNALVQEVESLDTFKGYHNTLADVQAVHPTAQDGWFAYSTDARLRFYTARNYWFEESLAVQYDADELYNDIDELLAAQGVQTQGNVYYVVDATDDPAVVSRGTTDAYYQYQSDDEDGNAGTPSIGDYELLPAEDINYTGELVKVTEGGNTGYRLKDADPANYGDIGDNAVDLSVSTNASTTKGATGDFSHTEGRNVTASGSYSRASGFETIASASNSFADGRSVYARSSYERSYGVYGTDYTPQNDNTDRAINYGYGTGDAPFGTRKDIWTLFKNGAHKFFTASLNTITNAAKGFVTLDENAKMHIHNGTQWQKIPDESDVIDIISENQSLVVFNKVTPIDDDLILEASTAGWDSKIREIGNYFIDDDGKHYQLYTGYTGASGVNSRLGIAVSIDGGQTFQKAGLNSDGKMFDTPSEDPYLVKKDGVYYLYSEESSNNPKKIQCHTSTDLINWVDRGIVIEFDGTDKWDSSSVASPTCIIKNDVFYLFYEGLNSPYGQVGQVGLATSNDGITFTKNTDPIITTSGFKQDFPLNWTDDDEIILWGNSAVPDDIIYMNGVYIMSLHVGIDPQGNKDFRTAVCYSYDLLNWKDLNNDKIESPNSGISFIRNLKNLQATYILESKKLLKGAVIKSSDSISSNAVGSEELVHSKKELISDGDTYINGKVKIQLDQFENDLDAYNNGVDYSQMYLNHLNVPVVNTTIYNLFGDSEPIDSSNVSASSVTFNAFDWGGFNDFTTAVNFDYSPSGQVFYLMPLTDGEIYNVSFFVKMDDGGVPRVNQTSTSPLSDFILLIGNEFASIDLKVEDYGNGIYRISGFSEKGVSNATGIRKGQFNSQRNFVATGFQITKGKDLKPYRKTPNTEIKQEDISGIYTTSKMFLQADYQLQNVTSAQKVFNVGKNGNGSIPLIEDNTYHFEIDLTLTNLPTSNAAVKFGFLGTALGDLKYIASTVKADSVNSINISVSSKQTSFTPVNITSFNDSPESTIKIKGTIICTNSGDFIPAIQMSGLNNAIVEKGSYCFIQKIGGSDFTYTNDID